MLTINKIEHAVARKDDLDDQLIAATGCNAAEIEASIGDFSTAGRLAFAVAPFLVKPVPQQVLAQQLEADMAEDRLATLRKVKGLFQLKPTKAKDVI